ncbi:MAG: hypothetical protein ACREIM_06250 [Nitrospiraceae bacterium]
MLIEAPTYRESLKIGWAIFWRTAGSLIALLFTINMGLLFLFPELSRTSPSLWIALVPLMVVSGLCIFLVMPHVARVLVDRDFRGFHLLFVRDQPACMATTTHAAGSAR